MEFIDCPCSGKTLAKLLHPAILICLSRGPAHGYAILQQLAEMKMFADDEPDHAGVYRTLKQMESQGYVDSQWDVQVGPARRVFSLTETGMACLRCWLGTLQRYRDAIDELLDQINALPGVG
jgi:DNA-binding PadR family transcriptional regulator